MTKKESKIAWYKKKPANAEELSKCFLQATVFFLSFFLDILSHFYLVASVANHSNLLLQKNEKASWDYVKGNQE